MSLEMVGEAEELARLVTERFGGGSEVSPFGVFASFGVDLVSEDLRGDVAGLLRYGPRGVADVILGAWDNPARRRFTCAHELGHYLRSRGRGEAKDFRCTRTDLLGIGADAEEIFANYFAAALLIPSSDVTELAAQGRSEHEMAEQFWVLPETLRLRLAMLGQRDQA